MNLATIIKYLYPELKPLVDYEVMDEGQGLYISQWNTNKYPKPTEEEILSRAPEVQADYDADRVKDKRAQEYPPIVDQLDMLWHAMDQNKIPKDNDFYVKIKEVKDRNPL